MRSSCLAGFLLILTGCAHASKHPCDQARDGGETCISDYGTHQEHLWSRVYYYDIESDRCHTMLYLGCEGNFNRFPTKTTCEDFCKLNNRGGKRALAKIAEFKLEAQPSQAELTEIWHSPDFSTYDSCFRTLGPSIASDLSIADSGAELHDILTFKSSRNGTNITTVDAAVLPVDLWEDGIIPYKLADSITEDEKRKLSCAFLFFHEKTCIRFKPKTSLDLNYVLIKNDGNRCFSDTVGKSGGEHVVNLDSAETHCWLHGTIVHELMHALGFYHEQSRNDRDDHIKIHWQNISPYIREEFSTARERGLEQQLIGVYDYKSVLHYPRYTAGKLSMTALDSPIDENNRAMGNRVAPTDEDALKISKLYKCDEPKTADVSTTMAPPPVTSHELEGWCNQEANSIWSPASFSCFTYYTTYLSWFDAMYSCNEKAPVGSRGRLAHVKDQQTLDVVRKIAKNRHLWVGLKSTVVGGTDFKEQWRGRLAYVKDQQTLDVVRKIAKNRHLSVGLKSTVVGGTDFEKQWRYMESVSQTSDETPWDPRPAVSVLMDKTSGECLIFSIDVWWDYGCENLLGYLCEFVPVAEIASPRAVPRIVVEDDAIQEETPMGLDVRLIGTVAEMEAFGRVEVYLDGEWGTVCNDLWDNTDATVFCKMIGYTDGLALRSAGDMFDMGTGKIHLDEVECTGEETSVLDCPRNPSGCHNCDHKEDAGVHCIK